MKSESVVVLTASQLETVDELTSYVVRHGLSRHEIKSDTTDGVTVVLRRFNDGSVTLSTNGGEHSLVCDSLQDLRDRLSLRSLHR